MDAIRMSAEYRLAEALAENARLREMLATLVAAIRDLKAQLRRAQGDDHPPDSGAG